VGYIMESWDGSGVLETDLGVGQRCGCDVNR
jgi:hypothetical protein